jgi:hypothetical protein
MIPACEREDSGTLELNKIYSVQNLKFTVKAVKIYKDGYPVELGGGTFSMRPGNPNMDPSYNGVLGIELNIDKGSRDAFSKLEVYIIDMNGNRNVDADMAVISSESTYTYLFNVPLSARNITFSIGGLKLDLEKALNK